MKGKDRSSGCNSTLNRLNQVLRWYSQTREARVARLRKAVANGSYYVPAGKLADKILRVTFC